MRDYFHDAMLTASYGRHLRTISILHRMLHSDVSLLHIVDLHNDCQTTKWLIKTYGITTKDLLNGRYGQPFLKACQYGNLPLAKYLSRVMGLEKRQLRSAHLFNSTCAHGSLQIAKWLRKVGSLSNKQMIGKDNLAFVAACEGGHLDTAKWLVKVTEMPLSKINIKNSKAFRKACYFGELKMAQWLAQYQCASSRLPDTQYVDFRCREWYDQYVLSLSAAH